MAPFALRNATKLNVPLRAKRTLQCSVHVGIYTDMDMCGGVQRIYTS
jgi:hypothetical protein